MKKKLKYLKMDKDDMNKRIVLSRKIDILLRSIIMNFIKALPVVFILVLLKYIHIQLIKRQIRADLDARNARKITIKLEKIEHRYDIYHITYELAGKIIERHVIYNLFSGMKWL